MKLQLFLIFDKKRKGAVASYVMLEWVIADDHALILKCIHDYQCNQTLNYICAFICIRHGRLSREY